LKTEIIDDWSGIVLLFRRGKANTLIEDQGFLRGGLLPPASPVVELADVRIVPETSSGFPGDVVPMPTLPPPSNVRPGASPQSQPGEIIHLPEL
jgi:hypothetical protein